MFKSILDAVSYYANQTPDKPCIIDEHGTFSYRDVIGRIHAISDCLIKLGIKQKDCVMVACTQDSWFISCGLACVNIGAIFVPVEEGASENRIRDILADTDAGLFISNKKTVLDIKFLSFDELYSCGMSDKEQPKAFENRTDYQKIGTANPKMTAEILYTTGTTGKCKGIELTNENNVAVAENIVYGTKMKKNNVELIPLPLSHSHGLRSVYANLVNGSTMVLMNGVMNVSKIFKAMDDFLISALDMTPSAISVILKLSKNKLAEYKGRLDYIQIGTAVLPENTKELLLSYLPDTNLFNFYGSTEAGRACIFNFRENKEKCIGVPSHNTKVMITDEKHNPIHSSKDQPGILAISGKMNMKGYWKQPQLTAQIQAEDFIYTSDIGYIDNDGFIYLIGRADNVINYKGINISPEEIEGVAEKYPDILECVCLRKRSELEGEYPKLYIVLKENVQYKEDDFMSFLRKNIDSNKLPKEIECTSQIPRTSNGKKKRN